MSETVAEAELKVLKDNPHFLPLYEQAVEAFRASGLYNFLRSVGRCHVYDGGSNPNRSAAEGHFNAGYHAALDDLMYFREQFLTAKSKAKKVPLDFGGRRIALAKGDLLEGDIK